MSNTADRALHQHAVTPYVSSSDSAIAIKNIMCPCSKARSRTLYCIVALLASYTSTKESLKRDVFHELCPAVLSSEHTERIKKAIRVLHLNYKELCGRRIVPLSGKIQHIPTLLIADSVRVSEPVNDGRWAEEVLPYLWVMEYVTSSIFETVRDLRIGGFGP